MHMACSAYSLLTNKLHPCSTYFLFNNIQYPCSTYYLLTIKNISCFLLLNKSVTRLYETRDLVSKNSFTYNHRTRRIRTFRS